MSAAWLVEQGNSVARVRITNGNNTDGSACLIPFSVRYVEGFRKSTCGRALPVDDSAEHDLSSLDPALLRHQFPRHNGHSASLLAGACLAFTPDDVASVERLPSSRLPE